MQFSEKISRGVAQKCLIRLLSGGLGHQRYSFQLLPSYRDAVESRYPGTIIDLVIDLRTGKSSTSLRLLLLIATCLQGTSSAPSSVQRNLDKPLSPVAVSWL